MIRAFCLEKNRASVIVRTALRVQYRWPVSRVVYPALKYEAPFEIRQLSY